MESVQPNEQLKQQLNYAHTLSCTLHCPNNFIQTFVNYVTIEVTTTCLLIHSSPVYPHGSARTSMPKSLLRPLDGVEYTPCEANLMHMKDSPLWHNAMEFQHPL